jgi:hypothetical protein
MFQRKRGAKILTNRCLFTCILVVESWFLFIVNNTEAEQLVMSNIDSRIILALSVDQLSLQPWLPDPWKVNPIAKGPLKDTNLFVLFFDRLIHQDDQGKPVAGGTYRGGALLVMAKHSQSGETTMFAIRTYTPHKDINTYNPYKVGVPVTIHYEHNLKATNLEPGIAYEFWEMKTSEGEEIKLKLEYERAVPLRENQVLKPRSAVDPDYYRIYRVDRCNDLIKSIHSDLDRVQKFEFFVTIKELSKVFDGNEKIVGILSNPYYNRRTYHP